MSNELPKIGLYVQWLVNGKLSEMTFLPASDRSPMEVAEALAALVPDGCVAEVVGFTLGNANNVWFTRQHSVDAIQQLKQHAAQVPPPPPPRSRM